MNNETVISVAEMRAADKYTIEHGTPSTELMFRAAQGVFDSYEPRWDGKKIAILTGSGNNAGDGYALAKILAESGVTPVIVRVSEKCSEDGKYYYDMCEELDIPVYMYGEHPELSGFDVVVDALLGTGFAGVPRAPYSDAISEINSSGAYVISVDINSGMNGDTGEAELAVKSDLTVSIGYYKKGFFSGDAPRLIGELVNVDIGITLPE